MHSLSAQTLCALFRGVHQKNKSASGFDIINMLMGFDKAEQRMKVSLDLICGRKKTIGEFHCFLVRVYVAGPNGKIRQPSLWRGFRKSEEPLS